MSRIRQCRPLKGDDKFFSPTIRFSNSWSVRYGGMFGGLYTFEICKSSEARTIEILQSIKIPKETFLDGFVIRGVLIEGIAPDQNGVIKFKVKQNQIHFPKICLRNLTLKRKFRDALPHQTPKETPPTTHLRMSVNPGIKQATH